jgi:hypothetical protein
MQYHIFEDYDIPFDEKGTTCGTVRLVQWVKSGAEPDREKAKIEIRKIYTSGAEEKTGKGYTFSTPDGPSELVHGLISKGFGDTREILRMVRSRDDFLEAANKINDDLDDSGSGEMFDMRDLLLGMDESDSYDEEDEEDDKIA